MSLAHAALMHPLSVAQFLALWEQGAFGQDARVELIEGEVVPMTPMGPRHRWVTSRVLDAIYARVGSHRADILCQMPIELGESSLPEPDIAIARPGSRADEQVSAHRLHLVAEVSDTTEAQDRQIKLPLYAAAPIPELWLVLPAKRIVEIHRDPDPAAKTYRSVTIAKPGDSIAPLAFPDAKIAVADFLPPEAKP
jgi:Uma2 family endonuclease